MTTPAPSTPFQKKRISLGTLDALKRTLRHARLHTVCESAKCPNIGECFCQGTATFLIGGNICTRGCRFCGVTAGVPSVLDADEPRRVADAVAQMGLRYAVITSVTRDDVPDGGAAHFAATIHAIRHRAPQARIEILTPDFQGNRDACAAVCAARPDVFAHNLETVPRLYPAVRSGAQYQRSLHVLAWAQEAGLPTKSGIMLGLGESSEEVNTVMDDLRSVNCSMLTIGQYLAPGTANVPVHTYIETDQFDRYKEMALAKGFTRCASAPYVRSSYQAESLQGM